MSQYQQLSDKFSALENREKQLILWVSLGLIIYLFFWFGVSPALDDMSAADKTATRKESEYKALVIQRDAIVQALTVDYTQRMQQELDNARKELLNVDEALLSLNEGFVAADRMPELLMTLLNEENNVSLVNFNVEATQAIRFGEGETQSTSFYRHNMRLVIEGSYFDLRSYLARLQSAPEKVIVTDFAYNVVEYPNASLTLGLATVSNNATFISL
ncbi:agglutinin biogenesis protein MshJ [Alteromonas sp. BL110]|uniref:type II secretion system protein M n=1 Tax=Alteromonas sp. BL110 TaxID=1714845 RepID=UPI000E51DC17|nr:type II secretion system protein M [Alteromonas sp. BL110]AXT38320.1 agglutinin biogenesis protein MshJ [Alteromonas sp. BL110]RKM83936.1 agglutinin biogenesis protein MshJ [Alteromonas sp. BL110]